MNLFVGYQLRPDSRFVDTIVENREHVKEVYFSWGKIPNGRNSTAIKYGFFDWEAIERQKRDLSRIANAGIGLNLLLNGNCYGKNSLARKFYDEIGNLIDYLESVYGMKSVTTTSPTIAKFIKENFPHLEVRASVNMEIGTIEGVEYLSEWFDGFYARRELNRRPKELKRFADSCHKIGKKVYMLANSGCLNYCSARQFHDNLVSHENEIAYIDNAYQFHGVCREFLKNEKNHMDLLRVSNWVRPEDLGKCANFVDGVKLATRVSNHPEMILRSYVAQSHSGNILQLMEPDFSDIYPNMVLDNHSLPEDFYEQVTNCSKNCKMCGKCKNYMVQALQKLPEIQMFHSK